MRLSLITIKAFPTADELAQKRLQKAASVASVTHGWVFFSCLTATWGQRFLPPTIPGRLPPSVWDKRGMNVCGEKRAGGRAAFPPQVRPRLGKPLPARIASNNGIAHHFAVFYDHPVGRSRVSNSFRA